MADDGSAQSTTVWPLPKFHFEVKWGDQILHFQEVSGLDTEAQPIEYRHGDSAQFSITKMPGLKKYSDVTLKKGVFKGDNKFWDWFNGIKMNTLQRVPVTIRVGTAIELSASSKSPPSFSTRHTSFITSMNGKRVLLSLIAVRGICSRKSYADTESKKLSSKGIGSRNRSALRSVAPGTLSEGWISTPKSSPAR